MRKRLLALSPAGGLARIGVNVFRKQLLRYGRWVHPGDSKKFFEVTPALCDQLVSNFDQKNFNDYIPVQLAKDSAKPHEVGPDDTVGRIVGLQRDTDGLYALMEFGDAAITDKATKNLIPGVSAGINLDYHNREQNKNVGPVLRHVVLCNDPYIKNLRGFEGVPLAEADDKEQYEVLEFAEVSTDMNRTQLLALAKKLGVSEADITAKFATDEALLAEVTRLVDFATTNLAEVPVLKEKAAKHDVVLAENTTLKTEVDTLKKTAPEAAKVVELSQQLTAVSTKITTLEARNVQLELAAKTVVAEAKVDRFITVGQVLPAQRADLVELAVSQPTMFDKLYNSTSPVVVDLAERGIQDPGKRPGEKFTAVEVKGHVDRYTGMVAARK